MMKVCVKTTIMCGDVISYIRALLPPTHTPPQVDEYRCRNRRAWNAASSATQVTWSIDGAEQEKDGKRKSDKTKPDKTKRENDKGLRKTKPPKRDGLASMLIISSETPTRRWPNAE